MKAFGLEAIVANKGMDLLLGTSEKVATILGNVSTAIDGVTTAMTKFLLMS